MKKIFFLIAICLSFATKAQNDFITIWKPSNALSTNTSLPPSNSRQIYFPGRAPSPYVISWSEIGYPQHNGTKTMNGATTELIDFGTPLNPIANNATYELRISGSSSFNKIQFMGNGSLLLGDITKIIEIKNWGSVVWSTFKNAFKNCYNLDLTATDSPNLTAVTDCSSMFYACSQIIANPFVNNWDVSHVTDMSYMFSGSSFNQYIGNWDISAVTNLSYMFWACSYYNQSMGRWDTRNVINMSNMFNWAAAFNQPIQGWDTSNVTDMSYMFSNAQSFNQTIGTWNTSQVKTMQGMFSGAHAFNQNLSNWNTSNVLDMSDMFKVAYSFNQNIGNWNTSKVTNISYMFGGASQFNQNIGNWNTSKVTNMSYMFSGATNFNQPLSTWDTSKVTDTSYMFNSANSFNQNLGNWNLVSLTSAPAMFNNSGLSCQNYDNTIIGWANNSSTPSNVNLGANGKKFTSSAAVAARNTLTNTKGWTFSGDIHDPNCYLATSETSKTNLKIYPNPTSDFINISTDTKIVSADLFDISGKIVLKSTNKKINISALPKGSYFLKVKTENGENSQKIIKQ